MSVDDAGYEWSIFDATEAFIVDDDVESLDPISPLINVRFDISPTPILKDCPVDVSDTLG